MSYASLRKALVAPVATFALLFAAHSSAQDIVTPHAGSPSSAGAIADFFGEVGDQIYQEDCIFELSQEQLEVQQALIEAYIKQGADSAQARQLAVKQIEPAKLSDECERIKSQTKAEPQIAAFPPAIVRSAPSEVAPPKVSPRGPLKPGIPLADRKVLPQWDCAPGVDYVTIQHKGYERKLTGGEICNPFDDIVYAVPDAVRTFRLGYTIKTGRLFIIADGQPANGRTIAWAISGRDPCRNNPDPDCLAARAVGPLPPGEYTFSSDTDDRVSWGPKSKRMVAGIY